VISWHKFQHIGGGKVTKTYSTVVARKHPCDFKDSFSGRKLRKVRNTGDGKKRLSLGVGKKLDEGKGAYSYKANTLQTGKETGGG